MNIIQVIKPETKQAKDMDSYIKKKVLFEQKLSPKRQKSVKTYDPRRVMEFSHLNSEKGNVSKLYMKIEVPKPCSFWD